MQKRLDWGSLGRKMWGLSSCIKNDGLYLLYKFLSTEQPYLQTYFHKWESVLPHVSKTFYSLHQASTSILLIELNWIEFWTLSSILEFNIAQVALFEYFFSFSETLLYRLSKNISFVWCNFISKVYYDMIFSEKYFSCSINWINFVVWLPLLLYILDNIGQYGLYNYLIPSLWRHTFWN